MGNSDGYRHDVDIDMMPRFPLVREVLILIPMIWESVTDDPTNSEGYRRGNSLMKDGVAHPESY